MYVYVKTGVFFYYNIHKKINFFWCFSLNKSQSNSMTTVFGVSKDNMIDISQWWPDWKWFQFGVLAI